MPARISFGTVTRPGIASPMCLTGDFAPSRLDNGGVTVFGGTALANRYGDAPPDD